MADAGHPETALSGKLGLKPGHALGLVDPPAGWTVPRLPDGARLTAADEPADVIVAFFRSGAQLADRLPQLADRIRPDRALWVAWPRRAGGHDSDITDNLVREAALPLGIVDVKVAALDADWSGLKFVWRRENR